MLNSLYSFLLQANSVLYLTTVNSIPFRSNSSGPIIKDLLFKMPGQVNRPASFALLLTRWMSLFVFFLFGFTTNHTLTPPYWIIAMAGKPASSIWKPMFIKHWYHLLLNDFIYLQVNSKISISITCRRGPIIDYEIRLYNPSGELRLQLRCRWIQIQWII